MTEDIEEEHGSPPTLSGHCVPGPSHARHAQHWPSGHRSSSSLRVLRKALRNTSDA